jgi:fumarate hydratase class II
MATALNPVIGYSSAAEISKESHRSGKTVKQISIEKGLLSEKEAKKVLDPRKLTGK